jgi:hypothetical protein
LSKLEELLKWVKERRNNLYPDNWEYDPLLYVERELEIIIKLGRGPASAP